MSSSKPEQYEKGFKPGAAAEKREQGGEGARPPGHQHKMQSAFFLYMAIAYLTFVQLRF